MPRAYIVGISPPEARLEYKDSPICPVLFDINWRKIENLKYLKKEVRELLFENKGNIFVLVHAFSNPENVVLIFSKDTVEIIRSYVCKSSSVSFLNAEVIIRPHGKLIVGWNDGKNPVMITNYHKRFAIITMRELSIFPKTQLEN